jgi:hypothetical protein
MRAGWLNKAKKAHHVWFGGGLYVALQGISAT